MGGPRIEEAKQANMDFAEFSPFYTLATLNAVGGSLANYYIRIFARQNASMQGLLVDSEHNETYTFRSALELLRFLRDHLNERLH